MISGNAYTVFSTASYGLLYQVLKWILGWIETDNNLITIFRVIDFSHFLVIDTADSKHKILKSPTIRLHTERSPLSIYCLSMFLFHTELLKI